MAGNWDPPGEHKKKTTTTTETLLRLGPDPGIQGSRGSLSVTRVTCYIKLDVLEKKWLIL